MGVDFLNCPACYEVFCDAEPYYHCPKCKNNICERCSDNTGSEDEDDIEICPICRGDVRTNDMKLEEIKKLVCSYDDNKANKILNGSDWSGDEAHYMGEYDLAVKIRKILGVE